MATAPKTGDGLRSGLVRCREADRRLLQLAGRIGGFPPGVAVLANGGYGRGDYTPLSDLDVVLLINRNGHEQFLRSFIQNLWDEGLRPGHTLLHSGEIDSELLSTPDRSSALLEARFVGGDEELAKQFEERINHLMNARTFRTYSRAKREEFQARRKKYGEVPRVIEPQLKSQAGGLRDMHYVLWVERARAARHNEWRLSCGSRSLILALLGRLRRKGWLTSLEARELANSYSHLLTLREGIREHTGKPDDQLTVPMQVILGRALGWSGGERDVMLALMDQTYDALEKISRFANEFAARIVGEGRSAKRKSVKRYPGLFARGKHLELSDAAMTASLRSPEKLLELVDSGVTLDLTLSGRDRHNLRRELAPLRASPLQPELWHEPIHRWLQLSEGFGRRMRWLDELDALGIWIPEWREITRLTNGSYYHTYSVDEHTLRALDKLDDLPGDRSDGSPAALWRDFPNRPIVYLAILMHDIAKRRGDEDHSRRGAELACAALTRLGFDKWVEHVAHLVSIHLLMEQTAFRRDSKDPQVLDEFASVVGSQERLDALYLLTVSDLSAVGRHVWTAWKGHLLKEPYLDTRDYFREGRKPREMTVADEVRRVAPLLDGDEQRARDFIGTMRQDYRRAVSAREIALHVKATEDVREGASFRWLIEQLEGYIVLTLITGDRIGLLADIAGLLVTQGIGIREARIFTREDGIVLDRFRAEDTLPFGQSLEERLAGISELWQNLSEGATTMVELLERFRRTRRLERTPAAVVESEIRITAQGDAYLVDVSGADSFGLLYRLCSVFADEGLDVRAARVSRRIDGIVDAFLVKDDRRRLDQQVARLNLIQRLRGASSGDV